MKRTSIAERLDAGGITSGGERVAGAVEQLLGQVPAGDGSLVEISTERIHVHPRNRKILDEDVADIVAGLKAGEPIINPLGVTAAADWNAGKPDDLPEIPPGDYMITAGGHRRLRAAEIAAVKTVPCIVRATFAGTAGRRAALLENVQRKDLDVFEQAEAIAELIAEPYKLSQRDVAKLLDVNQSHISKRIKLLRLPSTVRESVRLGKTPIADAVELARVVDQGPIFDDAWDRYTRASWVTGKQAVDNAIAEHERTLAITKAKVAAKEQGLRLTDRHPGYYAYTKSEPCALEGVELDADKHAGETCHVGYINRDGEIVLACDKPGLHLKTGTSKLKVKPKIARQMSGSSSGASRADIEGDALRRQLKKTQRRRFEVARSFLMPLGVDVTVEQDLIDRATIGHVFHRPGSANDVARIVVGILGLDTPKGKQPANQVEELQRNSRTTLATIDHSTLALVVAAAYFETRMLSGWVAWGDDHRFWLELLAANDYELSDLERKKLDKLKAATTEEEPAGSDDGLFEVRRCVKCGCTDDAACDGGCTWVAEDLCSACADAVDAGLIDDHGQLLEASEAVG